MCWNALMRQVYNMMKKLWFFFLPHFFLHNTTYGGVRRCLSDGTKSQRTSLAFKDLVHIVWSFPALPGYDMTRDHLNGRPPKEATDPQEVGRWVNGRVLPLSQSGLNVTLEWALDSRSQNRIKIRNQEFAHKGAFTGSWLGMPAEVRPQQDSVHSLT